MKRGLTVLSFGAGTDSGCLLQMYFHDPAFRKRYAPEEFIVVMSSTEDEHPETDAYREEIAQQCAQRGIPFFYLTGDMGYHTGHWRGGLKAMWAATSTIGSVAFAPSCSPRLKTDAIYAFLADYVRQTFGYDLPGKKSLEAFAAERGKIRVILGFAKGEERRVPEYAVQQTSFSFAALKSKLPVWRQRAIELIFPLIDLGMDRQACNDYLDSVGETKPGASQCFSCMYKSPLVILWSALRYPERFQEWVDAERRKLDAWADEEYRRARQRPDKWKPNSEYKNLGVAGKGEFIDGKFVPVTLLDTLAEAKEKYKDWTMEQLDEYRKSHGHCMNFKAAA